MTREGKEKERIKEGVSRRLNRHSEAPKSRLAVHPGANQIQLGREREWSTLGELMRSLQHLHKEGVDWGIANQLEEEQMFQTF